jgi:hypothetical protein
VPGGGGGGGGGAGNNGPFRITTSPGPASRLKLINELAALDSGEGFFLYFLAKPLARSRR